MRKFNIAKFRADVRKAKNDLHVTQKQLAKDAGVGHALLSKLFNGKLKYPTNKSVSGLCAALGLEMADYYPAEPSTELRQEDVVKTHEKAQATLTRANKMLDEVREKIAAITTEPHYDEEEEPKPEDETIEHKLQHARYTVGVLEDTLRQVTAERNEFEQKMTRAQDEVNDLKNAIDIKNDALSRNSHRLDALTIKLRDNDHLILSLLDFITRLRDGDVEQ